MDNSHGIAHTKTDDELLLHPAVMASLRFAATTRQCRPCIVDNRATFLHLPASFSTGRVQAPDLPLIPSFK